MSTIAGAIVLLGGVVTFLTGAASLPDLVAMFDTSERPQILSERADQAHDIHALDARQRLANGFDCRAIGVVETHIVCLEVNASPRSRAMSLFTFEGELKDLQLSGHVIVAHGEDREGQDAWIALYDLQQEGLRSIALEGDQCREGKVGYVRLIDLVLARVEAESTFELKSVIVSNCYYLVVNGDDAVAIGRGAEVDGEHRLIGPEGALDITLVLNDRLRLVRVTR